MKACRKHWWLLRLTSLPIIPLFFYFLSQSGMRAHDRAEFIAWASDPLQAALIALFIVCAFVHAALGMEEIIVDYVPTESTQKATLLINNLFFAALGLASLGVLAVFCFGN